MTQYVRGFVIPDVADVHIMFSAVIRTAEQVARAAGRGPMAAKAAATLAELRAAYVDFNDELRVTAVQASALATRDIRQRLQDTQVRDDTGASPHLRDLIVCEPLQLGAIQTGAVGVGLVSELNRAINPYSPGYGPYWRAQEYGTGHGEVPPQAGRILFGYFAGPGQSDATPPRAEFAGGGGPHPVFFSTASGSFAGPQGGLGGLGTIGRELPPRRFIGIGADQAAISWRARIGEIQARAVERIARA